jgi:hypothetical protein
MIVEHLSSGQVLKPTQNAEGTYPRRIEKNARGGFEFRRVLPDGLTGVMMWNGYASMKVWVRKHAAVIDGERFVPAFDSDSKGVQFFAKDSDGQWYYVNHAGTWQTCPPPVSMAGAEKVVARVEGVV